MPKTHRDLYRRKLAQAYINLNWAATYLLELYNIFNPVHPELGAYLMGAMEGLETECEILTQFAYDAWGKDEINWQSWAANGRPTHGTEPTPILDDAHQEPETPDASINEDKDNAP